MRNNGRSLPPVSSITAVANSVAVEEYTLPNVTALIIRRLQFKVDLIVCSSRQPLA